MNAFSDDQPDGPKTPVWKISLGLYPLGAGAAAVNIFFIGLLSQAIGFKAFSPQIAIIAGLILGVPFTIAFGRYFRRLMDEAAED